MTDYRDLERRRSDHHSQTMGRPFAKSPMMVKSTIHHSIGISS